MHKLFPLFFGASLALGLSSLSAQEDTRISPWGIGACHQTSATLEKWIPQMKEVGIYTLRAGRGGWGGVEPKEGEFNFTVLDQQIAFMQEQNMVMGGLLMGNPKWNHGRDKAGGMPVNNIEGWSRYVETTVRHAKGRIKYWEVWNEPPNFSNNAPPEDYAKLVVAAYDAAKRADPDCLVGIAAKSVDVNYIDRAIRAGAKGHFDYVTLHPYETLGFVIDDAHAEPVFMNIVPTVRTMLATLDPAKKDCPVWFTELGCNADRKGVDVHAQSLVKAYTMSIAQGVECLNWFQGRDGDSGPMGLLKADGAARPAYSAMKWMTTHLGPHPEPRGWLKPGPNSYAFAFKGAQGDVIVAWATTGKTDKLAGSFEIADLLSGDRAKTSPLELTPSPVVILNPSAELMAQAKANQGKPLTWGGEFATAKEISATMEGAVVEAGLHSRAGDALAADVADYGGGARAGDLPKGNAYMVDPTFLCWATVPIEITAEVMLNEKGDPGKVALEYESTSGYSKPTPFVIPDNKQWHKATWRINDAQFVGKYGFNFRFEKGKYYYRKVSVRKL